MLLWCFFSHCSSDSEPILTQEPIPQEKKLTLSSLQDTSHQMLAESRSGCSHSPSAECYFHPEVAHFLYHLLKTFISTPDSSPCLSLTDTNTKAIYGSTTKTQSFKDVWVQRASPIVMKVLFR